MSAFCSSPTANHVNDKVSFSGRSAESSGQLIHANHMGFPIRRALVVSGERSIRTEVGKVLLLCGVVPVFASTIEEATYHVNAGEVCFCICEDRLPDGKYEDLLLLKQIAGSSSPLIVVSPTGDWPDYFRAVDRGVNDFLAYPLIPGELQRIVQSFLSQSGGFKSASSNFFG